MYNDRGDRQWWIILSLGLLAAMCLVLAMLTGFLAFGQRVTGFALPCLLTNLTAVGFSGCYACTLPSGLVSPCCYDVHALADYDLLNQTKVYASVSGQAVICATMTNTTLPELEHACNGSALWHSLGSWVSGNGLHAGPQIPALTSVDSTSVGLGIFIVIILGCLAALAIAVIWWTKGQMFTPIVRAAAMTSTEDLYSL